MTPDDAEFVAQLVQATETGDLQWMVNDYWMINDEGPHTVVRAGAWRHRCLAWFGRWGALWIDTQPRTVKLEGDEVAVLRAVVDRQIAARQVGSRT